MFKVDNPGPVASGRPPAVEIVTKEMLACAWKAIEACAKARGKALSSAYGNFDKLVALGWLLGDVARGRLIDGAVAYRIGRKHGKRAPELKAAFEAPLRKHGKRKYEDDEASERGRVAAEQEDAELRREPVEIDFEEPPAAAAAPAAAAPAASASAMTPPPPRPPPTPPRSERVELLKALREAEAVVAQADGAVAAAKRDRDKAQAAWEYTRERASNPHRIAQISEDRWAAWNKEESSKLDACGVRRCAAERAFGDAEMALFQAKFELNEARFDLDEYEKERSRQDVWAMQMANMDAEHDEKCRQIEAGLAANNTTCNPGDPEYWDPDPREAAILYRLWNPQ